MSTKHSFVDKIIDNVLEEENSNTREIYSYCIHYLFEQLIFIAVILILGFLTNNLLFYMLFYLLNIGFRFTSGGYHAPRQWICNILSYSTIFVTLLLVNLLPDFSSHIWLFFCAIFSIIIVLLSPVDNPKKRLKSKQKIALMFKNRIFVS
ncbi:MAG: accessory gene regulator B family protein, partial [Eubacterium sp.]|nr:accessory gene regulator B family protein [Eubacterium sp.]